MTRVRMFVLLAIALSSFGFSGAADAAKPKWNNAPLFPAFQMAKPQKVSQDLKNQDVKVEISRDAQMMNVYIGGQLKHTWPVSTGRKGFKTPGGAYRPTWMTKMWHSKQWNNAPMPHSVFFREGYAIHATYETGNLGRPASHGCVRLSPKNAEKLFTLIKTHGEKKTRIVVS